MPFVCTSQKGGRVVLGQGEGVLPTGYLTEIHLRWPPCYTSLANPGLILLLHMGLENLYGTKKPFVIIEMKLRMKANDNTVKKNRARHNRTKEPFFNLFLSRNMEEALKWLRHMTCF